MKMLTLVYLAMTKICDEHLEELALGEGELLDALPEEVLLVHGVSVLLPPHKLVNQLPLNPKGDERRLGGRIFWSFSYCFSMSLTIIMHNLEIFSYFRLRIFPYTSLTSYFDF